MDIVKSILIEKRYHIYTKTLLFCKFAFFKLKNIYISTNCKLKYVL